MKVYDLLTRYSPTDGLPRYRYPGSVNPSAFKGSTVAGDSLRDLKIRKTLGIYYTPEWLARPLTSWALAENHGRILDPSFGGCAFLNAALDEFEKFGVQNGHKLVFGCDIDQGAMRFAEALYRRGVPSDHIRLRNFISSDTLQWLGNRFHATVGNPPYLRHHTMSDAMIESAQQLISKRGFNLSRRASAWAYFTLLSASCTEEAGRLAMVLPGALLHADYGEDLLSELSGCFGLIRLLHLRERLFRDAEEETVIILASDRGEKATSVSYQRVVDRDALITAISDHTDDVRLTSMAQHKLALLPATALEAWQTLHHSLGGVTLRDVGCIRIGVVTAANDFFIRTKDDPVLGSSSVTAIPIVHSQHQLITPMLSLTTVSSKAWNSYLLAVDGPVRRGSRLESELLRGECGGIAQRHHAKSRKVWYRIEDRLAPDAFMPYMSAAPRPLIRNYARALCTNSIHRVFINDRTLIDRVVAGSYGSLYRFEAELFGRNYGGGVLKIEPRAAMNMTAAIKLGVKLYDTASEMHYYTDMALRRRTSAAMLKELKSAATLLALKRNGSA